MKNKTILLRFDLQHFAEGSGTGADGTMGVNAADAMSQQGVQGEGSDAQSPAAQNNDAIDREAEFEKMIKGDYKEQYDKRVKTTVQQRLKGTKDQIARLEALAPALDTLGRMYGVDPTDVEALTKAVEADDRWLEEEAMRKGVTVDEIREFRRVERENEALHRQLQERERQDKAMEQYGEWMRQADQLRGEYPEFNLETELQNPAFAQLLQSPHITLRSAYQAVHHDELVAGAVKSAAQAAEKAAADKIMANGARPSENGMSGQSASQTKVDVSRLSNDQIDDILKRVRRGEEVTFN